VLSETGAEQLFQGLNSHEGTPNLLDRRREISRQNRSQYYWQWPQPPRQQLMAQFRWRRSSQSETTRFEWVHNIIKSLPEEARRQHHEHEADFR
ncbi:hypothetical protein, partial [Burkholderia gladioli]|uniref:hypothetical protein n=1 Tax=Burkholderia gladioli TaxID=28095 RepID=UPI002FE1EC49